MRGRGKYTKLLDRMTKWGFHPDWSLRTARRRASGRNTPCPCGSGLKYKRCCMNKAREEK